MSEWSKLAYIVEKIHQARVLVIGDVMLDRFVYGQISRISPEAPVPVLAYHETKSTLGGAGNVVRNLAALGVQTGFISVVGEDGEASEVEAMLHGLHTVNARIIREEKRKTIVKTRFIATRQQVLRIDSESTHPLLPGSQKTLMEALDDFIGDYDVVVLSDYGKGVLLGQTPQAVIDRCRKAGKPVIVDPKGRDYSRYEQANVITPNLKELSEASGMPVSTPREIIVAARTLIEQCMLEAVIATQSQDGMTLVPAEGDATHMRAEAKEVFDVSGAGDTVVAVTAAAMSTKAPLIKAAELANVAAGIVVGKVGTAVIYKKDFIQALHYQELTSTEGKVLDLETAVDIVELWRRKGYSVGFTNGVFDLLHPGHLSLLQQASKTCDRLIVGINSDDSVTRLKGEGPIQPESARSAILASLEPVHAVIIYQEDTPHKVLEAIRPDVLIKGSNYKLHEVVGSEIVQQYGGKVHIVDITGSPHPKGKIADLSKNLL